VFLNQERIQETPGVFEFFEVDADRCTLTFKRSDHRLSGHIARGSRREGATAESADTRIENPNSV
jgi:hypothetical protein